MYYIYFFLIRIKFVFLFFFITSYSIEAQEDSNKSEEVAQALYENIMSPYCPGRTLSACPSDDARKLREQIKSQVDQGYSSDAIKRQLSILYGKEILGEPEFNSFGLLAWLLPFLLVTVCSFIVVALIKKNKRFAINNQSIDLRSIENNLINNTKNE